MKPENSPESIIIMFVDSETKIEGVAAFIVLPIHHKVVTIEELHTKRSTNKIAGMRSIPMETIEPGETHEEALIRLLKEEVRAEPLCNMHNLIRTKLTAFQMIPDVWVHTYYLEASYHTQISLGSEAKEVANLKWENIRDLVTHDIGSRQYRGGNRESAWSFYRWWRSYSIPDIYPEITDRIPNRVFDDIEAGRNIALIQSHSPKLSLLLPDP